MNMKQKLFALLALSALNANASGPVIISMVQLLANGEQFNGVSVEVFGYVGGVGSPALYLTKDHVQDASSSVLLQVTDDMLEKFVTCRNRYVSVAGDLILDEGALFLENIRSIFDSDQVVFCYRE